MSNTIKLILTDMDGTLLNNKHQMPSDTFEVIQACLQHQIIFGIASGRQLHRLIKQFEPIRNEILFIAENGACAMYQDKIIHFSAIDMKIVTELVEQGRKLKQAWPILCGKKGAYIECNIPEVVEYCREYCEILTVVPDLTLVEDEICKVTIYDTIGSEVNSYKTYKNWCNQLQITVSGQSWLDLCNLGESKGHVLQIFQKENNITVDQTMAFGDYLNDVSLLQQAKFSYAMKNAHPNLFNYAHNIAPSNEEEGVTTTIKQFLEEDII